MTRGSIKGSSVYTVGDGCGSPAACVAAQKEFNAPGQSPFMCSECYTGWLTHWGEHGANTSSSSNHVDAILGQFHGSVSLYMGHGGTNFGFWSGANGGGGSSYEPHVTSYDYDSPVSEAGEHGFHAGIDKYTAMQTVLIKHTGQPPAEAELPPRQAFGTITTTARVELLDAISALSPGSASGPFEAPPTMESQKCPYGFMLYSATAAATGTTLTFSDLKDRVQVFVEGLYAGVAYRVRNCKH